MFILLAGKIAGNLIKPPIYYKRYFMRTGQRDVHNTPLKRRLSVTYEELETLKKSIKISVLNELREEIENISDQESLKDTVLSEIRTELMGIPDPTLLKASILNELKTELNNSKERDSGTNDRKIREIAGIQDGLVRELLDQKIVIKRLEAEVENLTKKLEDFKKSPITAPPSLQLTIPDDPLDLPPLKLPKSKPGLQETPERQNIVEFRERASPQPGPGTKVRLKLQQVEPKELDEEIETKCEYIIAESGDKRRFKGNIAQQYSGNAEPLRHPSFKPAPLLTSHAPVELNSTKPRPENGYKCEYIIAEKTSKQYYVDESVDLREHEDAELITCSRKKVRA
jgi:hypothetical protein